MLSALQRKHLISVGTVHDNCVDTAALYGQKGFFKFLHAAAESLDLERA